MSRIWIFLLIFTTLLAGCMPAQVLSASTQDWAYADLRSLDPVDAPSPNLDLLAGYTRQRPGELQVRLDLLEMNPQPDFDLYLVLDFLPGGASVLPIQAAAGLQWDALLVVPASGAIRINASQDGAGQLRPTSPSNLRVLRDPTLDTLTISLKQAVESNSAQPMTIQVFLTPAGQASAADALGPFRSDGLPPQPAQALFAFWNTFPAYTSAQALRRWDGAHTGPQGGRHGLYNLLRVARAYRVPITLLDLNQPAALSALDYLGELGLVQEMVSNGLLTLPQALLGFAPQAKPSGIETPPAWVLARAWQEGRRNALEFGLPGSAFIFSPAGLAPYQAAPGQSIPGGVRGIFLPASALSTDQPRLLVPTDLLRWQGQVAIPIPGFGDAEAPLPQATEDGLSLEVRRGLVETALAGQSRPGEAAPILVLGGDLPASAWGNPELARLGFHYLLAHPWVKLLDALDLLSARPAGHAIPNLAGEAPTVLANANSRNYQALLDDLRHAPSNALGTAAWQTYLAAYAPAYPSPADLPVLRLGYLGQVGVLLEAARWVENPSPIASCEVDPDLDGQPECVISSSEIFAVFELDFGGYLASAFYRSPDGQPHQFIGPSSQLISGLSESSTWDLSRGALADPGVIPGAFIDSLLPGQSSTTAEASIEPGQVTLAGSTPVGSSDPVRKTFRLAPGEIQVQYSGLPAGAPYSTYIPLLLDPWMRFSPGWSGGYLPLAAAQGLAWQLTPGLTAEIYTSTDLSLNAFIDSQRFLNAPEDPNRDYPAGHYLPFPLALVDLAATGDFTATLHLIH